MVSTWEPSKSPEYFQMLLRVLENFGVVAIFRDQLGREPHRLQLIIQIFAMFERKVQEHSHYRGQLAVKSSCDSVAGQFTRLCVSCERPGCAAEHVARELIEQQNQRETTSWLVLPVLKTSVLRHLRSWQGTASYKAGRIPESEKTSAIETCFPWNPVRPQTKSAGSSPHLMRHFDCHPELHSRRIPRFNQLPS